VRTGRVGDQCEERLALSPECVDSIFLFVSVMGFKLKAYTLSHSTSPFFGMYFFKIGSHELFSLGWLQTTILLISTS
jgi:hypothetical protein